jgi:hypothetical protein
MFKHILVPIDLSDRNVRTLRMARLLAAQSRARVTLLHVVQHVAHLPLGEMRPFYRRLVATSRRRLADAARPFAAEGLSVRTEVMVGEGLSRPAGHGQEGRPRGDGLAPGESGTPESGLGDDELQGRDLLPVPDPAREVGRDT